MTLVLHPLREVAPVVSLGVVYLIAVLLVSSIWGLALGGLTAVASAVAFNLFHLPPTGRLTLAETENWVALGVFLVTAAVCGTLADQARARAEQADRRSREGALAAELARLLLAADDLESALAPASRRIAQALGISSAQLTLGPRPDGIPLRDPGGGVLGTLVLPAEAAAGARGGVVPTLEALLQAARDRERLVGEVVETRALRRSEQVKTALLRAVSHDLRTPLTAISASAEALRSPNLDAGDRLELSADIRDEATRLAKVVDNLIDLGRLEAGKAEPRRGWVSLAEVLEGASEGLDHARLDFRLPADLPLLHADAAQVERALHNLLENAVLHSGGRPVQVRARAVGARLVIRVVDRGPGIPEAEHERIFEPFYRPPGNDRRSAGSGLGLAIVKGFLEANGGSVDVESLPGQGATFVVGLPLVEGAR